MRNNATGAPIALGGRREAVEASIGIIGSGHDCNGESSGVGSFVDQGRCFVAVHLPGGVPELESVLLQDLVIPARVTPAVGRRRRTQQTKRITTAAGHGRRATWPPS